MRYRSRAPTPPLRDFVEYFWSLSDTPAHTKERVVPDGTLELVVNLHEDELRVYDPFDGELCRRYSGAVVSGVYRSGFVIDTREHTSILGVHFRPGGAVPFLGLPPGALADTHVDLDTLWGSRARELRERVCLAPDRDRFRILEEALLVSFRNARGRTAVRFALDRLASGNARIGEIATQAGLSRRRLIEVFTADVGMAPKLFGRVRRFQCALERAQRPRSPAWSQLAIECGYFDQSHMIRDFVDLSGFSPAELVRHRGNHVKEHHLALPD